MSNDSTIGGTSDDSHNLPPPNIPNYKLIKLIGEGSFGQVWVAMDATDSPCAIKIIYKRKSKKDLFWKEFEGVKNYLPISRSNLGLVTILHVGKSEDDSFYYYTMELADDLHSNENENWQSYEAKSLSSYIKTTDSPCNLDEFGEIALNLSNGLGHLHTNGLVHRDIKPSNVIFVNGIPKLADVGLVSIGSDASTFIGTTGYIPPEGPGTPQADIYAIGKTLYELLTGNHIGAFPELPTQVYKNKGKLNAFSEFNKIIANCTSPDFRERFENGNKLREELLGITSSLPATKKVSSKSLSSLVLICFAIVCLSVIGLGLSNYSYSPKVEIIKELIFKHFRYYDQLGHNLLDGKFQITSSLPQETFCSFKDGILTKVEFVPQNGFQTILFFNTEKIQRIKNIDIENWIPNLIKTIKGYPGANFPHEVVLVRQIDQKGQTVTEASFYEDLINSGKSIMANKTKVVSGGDGTLIWHNGENFWVHKYLKGKLFESIDSKDQTRYNFEYNEEENTVINRISFKNGETIKQEIIGDKKEGNFSESIEHRIDPNTTIQNFEEYKLHCLIGTRVRTEFDNGKRIEFVHKNIPQSPLNQFGETKMQGKFILKIPRN